MPSKRQGFGGVVGFARAGASRRRATNTDGRHSEDTCSQVVCGLVGHGTLGMRPPDLRRFQRTHCRTMKISFLPLLCVVAAACSSGGGGGGNPLQPSKDPGVYTPEVAPGIGAAGAMDGIWLVTSTSLVADARTRNPNLDDAQFLVGDVIEFREGRVYEGEDDFPEVDDPAGPQVEVVVEFAVNDPIPEGTLYGFGFRVGPNEALGAGAIRVAAIFGTTGPMSATGMLVEEHQFAGGLVPAEDWFQVVQIELQRVSFSEELDAAHAASLPRAEPAVPLQLDGRKLRQELQRQAVRQERGDLQPR